MSLSKWFAFIIASCSLGVLVVYGLDNGKYFEAFYAFMLYIIAWKNKAI